MCVCVYWDKSKVVCGMYVGVGGWYCFSVCGSSLGWKSSLGRYPKGSFPQSSYSGLQPQGESSRRWQLDSHVGPSPCLDSHV